MKKIMSFNNSYYQKGLARTFKDLSRKALRRYKRQGETEQAIEMIQRETLKFYHNKFDTPLLMKMLSSFILDLKSENQHSICPLIDTQQIQVVLHLAPEGTVFPLHAHPDSLNIVLLVAGGLLVEQFTDQGRHKWILLKEHGCSVGLKNYYNRHALQATQKVNVFFSIRCKASPCYWSSNNIRFAFVFSALLLLAYAYSDFDPEANSVHSGIEIKNDSDAIIVELANQIRTHTDDDEILYRAVSWYLKAAANQNAEAQYWLGVMYLKGMGVTDDSDEALDWISASSDQNYPPAKELLEYILTNDEVLDC